MEAVNHFFTTLFAESGTLILLFIIAGVFLNVFGEIIKKTIYPRITPEESAAGKVQKECPGWAGMVIGISLTLLFLACTIAAEITHAPHCSLVGGWAFLPIWAIAFYLWQMICMKLVKAVMKRICPIYMTGKPRPPKPKKDISVPAGYKLVKEEETSTEVM